MALINLIYVSSGTQLFSQADLLVLLERSRRNNESVGITGMLLYRDGNFIQALEGEEQAVSTTHARIAKDPRHNHLITLSTIAIEQRTFADWSMGFRNLDSAELRSVPGYNEFMNEDWRGRQMCETPDRALKLLRLFRKGMR